MALQFIDNIDISGKRVLARFDFNVPLDKDDATKILDTSRIDLALDTIRYFIENGASKITLMSHLGRPKGQVNKTYSLEAVANYLAKKLRQDVVLTEAAVDVGVKELLTLKQTKVVLLENLRFHPEEEENDEEFAQKLSQYGDIYVNDAFGAAHRKHASVYEINKFFTGKAFGGLLLKKEIESLSYVLDSPKKPFVAIIGGAKVSDKIKTIEKLLVSVDKLIIGGAMAYPFLKAKAINVGTSLCSQEDYELALRIIRADKGGKIVLPKDHVVSNEFGGSPEKLDRIEIPNEKMGLDIGEQTIKDYSDIIKSASTVIWNGPMGLFENKDFSEGTFSIAKSLSECDGFTLVGGGDSVSAVKQSGYANKMSHISTGGGASLEFIEKGQLPGIQALKFGVS